MPDKGARRVALHLAGRQGAKARRIFNPRLQRFPAPSLGPTAKGYLGRKLSSGDTTVDAGPAQGGDTDDVGKSVERRFGARRKSRRVLGLWHGLHFLEHS